MVWLVSLTLAAVCGVIAVEDLVAALLLPTSLLMVFLFGPPAWLALAPFVEAYMRYPYEGSIITFSRLAVPMIFAMSFCALVRRSALINIGLTEVWWGVFSAFILINLGINDVDLVAMKLVVDGFLLPLLLVVAVRNWRLSYDTIGKILVTIAILLPVIGALEFSSVDLWPFPGSELVRDGVIRPNGPYSSDNSYALICLLTGLALIFFRPFGVNLWMKFKKVAVVFAFTGAMLPQFRSVGLAAVGTTVLGYMFWKGFGLRQLLLTGVIIALATTLILAVGGRRMSDTTNFFNRVATYRVAVEIATANWLSGVGFGRYEAYFNEHYRQAPKPKPYTKQELAQMPQSTPHNNFLLVAAELGLVGLLLYLIVAIVPFVEAYRLYRYDGACAAALFTFWASYHLVGLTLSSGYYGDVNLFLMFLHGAFVRADKGDGESMEALQS